MGTRQGPVQVGAANLPSSVRIWEVGPRDGLQNEQQIIDTDHKVAFIDRLSAAGLPVIEATSFVRANRIPQLADGAKVMSRITRKAGVRYPVLVPNDRGLDAAVAADARDIAVFASATNTFAERNLGRTLANQCRCSLPWCSGRLGRASRCAVTSQCVSVTRGKAWLSHGRLLTSAGNLLMLGAVISAWATRSGWQHRARLVS